MDRASPAKRPRTTVPSNHFNASDISSSIQRAITSNQRNVVLDRLFSRVGYNKETGICEYPDVLTELARSGTINALCFQLGFVLYRHGSSIELHNISTSLGLFFSHCPEATSEESIEKLGLGFVELLLKVAKTGVIQSILTIWHGFSASVLGTSLLLQCPGVLSIVVDILHGKNVESDGVLEALGMLKNVTYYAEDLRYRVLDQPGLIAGLTKLVFQDGNGKGQERVSAIYRNLAISPGTRSILGQNSEVLSALVRISSCSNRTTLRNLLNALISMAVDGESCLFLVLHGDGILIDICKRLVEHDNDSMIRKRSARALRLMARDSVAPLLMGNPRLIDTLAHRVLHDKSNEVRAEAAEALTRCAGLVNATMDHHGDVLDMLTNLANRSDVSPDVVARAFREQASHVENRIPMARSCKLIAAIASIAISTQTSATAKEDSCHALLNISNEESTREMIAIGIVFEALVRNSNSSQRENCQARECAVRALANLAQNPKNRRKMAKHSALLQVLLQFVSYTTDEELKKEVKNLILQLAAEL